MTKQELERKIEDLRKEIANLDISQNALKTSMNSAFGATSNAGFIFYDLDIGESITIGGRFTIQWIAKYFNNYLDRVIGTSRNRVIYSDTDSTFLHIKEIVNKYFRGKNPNRAEVVSFMDNLCKNVLNKVALDASVTMQEFFNLPNNRIISKREVLADKVLFVGAKNYISRMMDKEGVAYPNGKLKTVGISIARFDTPKETRVQLKKALDIILDGEEADLHKFIADYKARFEATELFDIAKPATCKNITKHLLGDYKWRSGCPVHVKAAINYNRMLSEKGLDGRYQPLTDGAKIRYFYLRTPNPAKADVIAFVDKLPPEFQLEKFLDYTEVWNSCFMNFLNILLEPRGWTAEPVNSIEDSLFG